MGEMKGKAKSTGVHGLFGQVGTITCTCAHTHTTHKHPLGALQAFGVGALEEEDDDIYGAERITDYHSSALAEEEGEEQFGWTGPHATGELRREGRRESRLRSIHVCVVSAETWSLSTAFSQLKRALGLQKVSIMLLCEVVTCTCSWWGELWHISVDSGRGPSLSMPCPAPSDVPSSCAPERLQTSSQGIHL